MGDSGCVGTTDGQHRQNELAGQVDIPTRVEVSWGILDTCRDYRCQPVKNNTDRMTQLVR